MSDDEDKEKGYDKIRDQILELCKLAQGNITTIHWCKTQLKKRLKVLDRLAERLAVIKESKGKVHEDTSEAHIRLELLIKKQTDACKELGDKIKTEIESLDAIRIASKAYGIDIKTRLLEIDDKLELSDMDEFFDGEDE
jgi:hypothetical protein